MAALKGDFRRRPWKRVVFAADCDGHSNCPGGIDYAERAASAIAKYL